MKTWLGVLTLVLLCGYASETVNLYVETAPAEKQGRMEVRPYRPVELEIKAPWGGTSYDFQDGERFEQIIANRGKTQFLYLTRRHPDQVKAVMLSGNMTDQPYPVIATAWIGFSNEPYAVFLRSAGIAPEAEAKDIYIVFVSSLAEDGNSCEIVAVNREKPAAFKLRYDIANKRYTNGKAITKDEFNALSEKVIEEMKKLNFHQISYQKNDNGELVEVAKEKYFPYRYHFDEK